MTPRLPIPAITLLGLQLGAGCHHEDPIVGHWDVQELEGQPKPDGVEMSLDIDAGLGGDFNYSIAASDAYHYDYHSTLELDARAAPTYVLGILPTDALAASQLRCVLAGDTLTCTDVSGAGLGDPVFKRG